MAPIQVEIVKVLEAAAQSVSMSDLVNRVSSQREASPTEVKAALLPMISGERVELTPDRKLRLRD